MERRSSVTIQARRSNEVVMNRLSQKIRRGRSCGSVAGGRFRAGQGKAAQEKEEPGPERQPAGQREFQAARQGTVRQGHAGHEEGPLRRGAAHPADHVEHLSGFGIPDAGQAGGGRHLVQGRRHRGPDPGRGRIQGLHHLLPQCAGSGRGADEGGRHLLPADGEARPRLQQRACAPSRNTGT